MDYKVLILLLALLFLVLLLFKEVINIRENMLGSLDNLTYEIREENNRLGVNLHNNITKCVSQIKDISADNLQQLRKITFLNHQPITKMASCHYTETEDSELHTGMGYFSDIRDDVGKIQVPMKPVIKVGSDYYMSEDSVSKSRKPIIRTVVMDDQLYHISIPLYKSAKSVGTSVTSSEYDSSFMNSTTSSKLMSPFKKEPVVVYKESEESEESNEFEESEESDEFEESGSTGSKSSEFSNNSTDFKSDVELIVDGTNILTATNTLNRSATFGDNLVKVKSLEKLVIEDDVSEDKTNSPNCFTNTVDSCPCINFKNTVKDMNEIEIDIYNLMANNKVNYNINNNLIELTDTFNTMVNNINHGDIYVDVSSDEAVHSGMEIDMSESVKQMSLHNSCNVDTVKQVVQEIDETEQFVEPKVEPAVEPAVEPEVEPIVEPVAEPTVEPVVEPTVEPVEPKSTFNLNEQLKSMKAKEKPKERSKKQSETRSNYSRVSRKSKLSVVVESETNKSEPLEPVIASGDSAVKNAIKNRKLDKLVIYTFDDLKNIAKQLSVPVSYKDSKTKKWVNYKKDELYKNITAFLQVKAK
jgi:hypothetical protein